MLKKKGVLAVALVAILSATLFMVDCMAQDFRTKRYRADLYVNFQFERTIEIEFDPQAGAQIQKVRVYETTANFAASPATPPGGELVELVKDGDNKWYYHRSSAVRSANIKRDESGKLIIFYFTRGSNIAEGELKPVQ